MERAHVDTVSYFPTYRLGTGITVTRVTARILLTAQFAVADLRHTLCE